MGYLKGEGFMHTVNSQDQRIQRPYYFTILVDGDSGDRFRLLLFAYRPFFDCKR